MLQVIGVQFQKAGKLEYYAPVEDAELCCGDRVVVESKRGVEAVSYTHLTLPTKA